MRLSYVCCEATWPLFQAGISDFRCGLLTWSVNQVCPECGVAWWPRTACQLREVCFLVGTCTEGPTGWNTPCWVPRPLELHVTWCGMQVCPHHISFFDGHVLYSELKDKGFGRLMVLNAVILVTPHRLIGMCWELLHKFHLRIVFFLPCLFMLGIKVFCTALRCRINFHYEHYLFHSSQMMLLRSYTHGNTSAITVTVMPVRLVLLFQSHRANLHKVTDSPPGIHNF